VVYFFAKLTIFDRQNDKQCSMPHSLANLRYGLHRMCNLAWFFNQQQVAK